MEYSIGDLSKITRVSGRTLHNYHLEGLVIPNRIDKFSRHRFFDDKTLHRVKVVQRFHSLGISARTIKEILAKHKDTKHLLKLLQHSLEHEDHTWEKLGVTREMIQVFMQTQSLENVTLGKLEIKILPHVLAACKRFHGLPEEIQSHFTHLLTTCGTAASGHPILLFHDDHQYDDEMDLECCLPVNHEVPIDGVTYRTIAGTKAVSISYEGPADGVWMGYQKIIDHLNKHNLAIQSPSREVWLSSDQTRNDEIRHIEIQFLIGDPNDPDFKRDLSRPGYGIGANFDL